MKRCFKCGETKPLTEFYRHARMGDGHLNKCKNCTKRDAALTRRARPEYYREYDRKRAALPHRTELRKQTIAHWRAEHPERKRAHSIFGHAFRAGKIKAQPCFVCGERAEAHHPDYSAPLDVVWLCTSHHKQAHADARGYSYERP